MLLSRRQTKCSEKHALDQIIAECVEGGEHGRRGGPSSESIIFERVEGQSLAVRRLDTSQLDTRLRRLGPSLVRVTSAAEMEPWRMSILGTPCARADSCTGGLFCHASQSASESAGE